MRLAPLRFIAALIMALSLLPVAAAFAQVATRVLVVDIDRLRAESLAGTGIMKATSAFREEIQREISDRETAIREEERKLARERPTLSEADFDARVDAFDDLVQAQRRLAETESRRLQLARSRAQALLTRATQEVLAAMMREMQAHVLLDKSQIILSVSAIDITAEAIERLNRSTPEIPFILPDTEPLPVPAVSPPE